IFGLDAPEPLGAPRRCVELQEICPGYPIYGRVRRSNARPRANRARSLRPRRLALGRDVRPGRARTLPRQPAGGARHDRRGARAAAQWLALSNSESPDFVGRAVAALAADPDVLRHTGRVL